MLQCLHHLPSPSLDSLQHDHVLLVLQNPEPDQTVQTSSGLSALKGTLLAYIQLFLPQHSQDLSSNAAFQVIRPQHLLVHGVIPPQGQHLALPSVKLHEVPASLFLQHVRSL